MCVYTCVRVCVLVHTYVVCVLRHCTRVETSSTIQSIVSTMLGQDNLILDQPRQRRQTRRFGNDSALADDVEEEEVMELVPARGKKGWTKLELQKVERYLLIYGWNQWRRILHSGFKGKKIRLGERDIENMSRTIVSPSTTCC